jgi:hypothetical protein
MSKIGRSSLTIKHSKSIRALVFLSLVMLAPCLAIAQKCTYSTDEPKTASPGHILVTIKGPAVNSIEGRVFDPVGKPIPEATVVLMKLERRGAKYIGGAWTQEDGRYCFGPMPEGKYRLEVGSTGFNGIHVLFTVSSRATSAGPKNVVLEVGT